MANLGRMFLCTFILLFALKALSGTIWPVFKSLEQVILIEEESENEDADFSFEFEFADELLTESESFYLSVPIFHSSKNAYFKACDQGLYIVHIPTFLRPPSIA
jgi:hypothetical protein